MDGGFLIRTARKNDLKDVEDMILELAAFEGITDEQKVKEQDLFQCGGFSETSEKLFNCFIAECDEKVVGYTISYFTFSTCSGKSYYLEDIYVRSPYRKLGIGKALLKENIRFAVREKCHQLDLRVMQGNPSVKFYKDMQFENLTEIEGWQLLRIHKNKMLELLSQSEN